MQGLSGKNAVTYVIPLSNKTCNLIDDDAKYLTLQSFHANAYYDSERKWKTLIFKYFLLCVGNAVWENSRVWSLHTNVCSSSCKHS